MYIYDPRVEQEMRFYIYFRPDLIDVISAIKHAFCLREGRSHISLDVRVDDFFGSCESESDEK